MVRVAIDTRPVSDLPAGELSYETVVTEYFLGLRGIGLMLSPLDQEQVRAWERRGAPVAVVCAGLRQALADAREHRPPGSPLPKALRAYRIGVEAAIRAHRSGRVGSALAPPCEEHAARVRFAAARELLGRLARGAPPPLRQAYLTALSAAGPLLEPAAPPAAAADGASPGATGPGAADVHPTEGTAAPGRAGQRSPLAELDSALAGIDAAALAAWLRALPRARRAALGPRCRLRAGARHPLTRPASYREALRAHVEEAAREAGLIRLRGSV